MHDLMVAIRITAQLRYCQVRSIKLQLLVCLPKSIWARRHWSLYVVLPLLLAACATGQGVDVASTWRRVSPENTYVLPPPGGPSIVTIMQRQFSNATQQDIALATTSGLPGQNLLRVQFFGPTDAAYARNGSLSDISLPATNISAEIRKQMPGVSMRRSGYYVQNRYGPFGYATGRAGKSDTCLYAWQRIRAVGRQTTLIRNRGTIQIRVRLCETGASEQQLLSFMYGFSIIGSFGDLSWNPYGSPAAPPYSLGRPGEPIYPQTMAEPGASQSVSPAAPRNTARPRQAQPRPANAAQPAPLPAPIGPAVPPPPGTPSAATVVPPPPCLAQAGGQNGECN